MKNQLIISIFFFLFLCGCADVYKKPLTFISPELGFYITESDQSHKIKRKDCIAYLEKDSFDFCKNFEDLQLKTKTWYGYTKQYYFTDKSNYILDHVTLDYYKENLVRVEIFSKGKLRNDSITSDIQIHLNKKMNWDSTKNGQLYGQIIDKELHVLSIINSKTDEMITSILNHQVINPFICRHTKSQKKARKKQKQVLTVD